MDQTDPPPELRKKKDRNFAQLQLNTNPDLLDSSKSLNLEGEGIVQPLLVIQSPKTPTLSRKLKAVSLDSDAGQKPNLEVARDVSSVPNTPKKQAKLKEKALNADFDDSSTDFNQKSTLTPLLGSNLKRFASNTSISGSQTLKTLPEVMTLQDFSGAKVEPIRIKAKGLLERRGSNASLTIDLGSSGNLSETKHPPVRLNTAKSVSNLNLTSFGCEKCLCHKNKDEPAKNCSETAKKHSNNNDKCKHTIYESVPSGTNHIKKLHHNRHSDNLCKCTLKFLPKYYIDRHCVCNIKFRRKSLSNENLYVPPCNFCHFGSKDCYMNKACVRGSRRALYPRQTYIETSQMLSEDFKLHLQNIQYLQTAGSILSIADLKASCQMDRIARLHQEFWEIPLNLQEKCLVSGSQSKNRYKGVLPNEHSRVHLPGPQTYIHANYVKGPDYTETAYIATQGPMTHTCEDFWNMIWCHKAKQIIMLTGLIEKGRNKCELYFPIGEENNLKDIIRKCNSGNRKISPFSTNQNLTDSSEDECMPDLLESDFIEFGPYTIKYIGKEDLGECVIRTLELNKNVIEMNEQGNIKESKLETRILYHYWYPNWADHKLANPEQVLKIALRVLGLDKDSKHSSTTESTSSELLESDSSTNIRLLDDKMGVESDNSMENTAVICNLRLDDNTDDKILRLSNFKSKKLLKSDSDKNLSCKNENNTDITNLRLCCNTKTKNFKFGFENENLEEKSDCSTNLRLVDDKMFVDSDILTKNKQEISNLLNLDDKNSEKNFLRLGYKNTKFNLNNFENRDNTTLEALNLTDDKVFSFDIDNEKTKNKFTFESETLGKKDLEIVNKPIVVHCSAGIGRTGCFLAILNGIQQLRSNYNVDILAIVCSLRLNRGGMVQTAEQYELIHRVLSLYAELFTF